MTEDKKREMHPIVESAIRMAYIGLESIEFDDYAVEQLQDLLKKHFGKPDLVQAVEDLIKFAYFLDIKGSHSASRKMIKVVNIASEALNTLKNKIKNPSNEEK